MGVSKSRESRALHGWPLPESPIYRRQDELGYGHWSQLRGRALVAPLAPGSRRKIGHGEPLTPSCLPEPLVGADERLAGGLVSHEDQRCPERERVGSPQVMSCENPHRPLANWRQAFHLEPPSRKSGQIGERCRALFCVLRALARPPLDR